MKKILLATKNPGKIDDIKMHLSDLDTELVSIKDLNITEEVEEDGKTFKENALKKAEFFAEKSGLPAIADDSGLEIDALDGEPGVKSRRWLGYKMTDQELIDETLKRLKDVKKEDRGAQFRTVVALAAPDSGVCNTVEGIMRGYITEEPSPKIIKGFPFRSIFYVPKFGKLLVDLKEEEKRQILHRSEALNQLKPYIKKLIKQNTNHQY